MLYHVRRRRRQRNKEQYCIWRWRKKHSFSPSLVFLPPFCAISRRTCTSYSNHACLTSLLNKHIHVYSIRARAMFYRYMIRNNFLEKQHQVTFCVSLKRRDTNLPSSHLGTICFVWFPSILETVRYSGAYTV